MNEHGNAYCNMTNEAKELYEQYHRLRDHYYFYSYNLGANAEAKFYEEKSHEVLIKMLDICDTRLFCVVTGNEHVRHIFRVEEEAVNRLEELEIDLTHREKNGSITATEITVMYISVSILSVLTV